MVTLEEQPDEGNAFCPAAPLVAEWRKLRTGGDQAGSRVERAAAQVRRWDLETEMLRDWQFTLPPRRSPWMRREGRTSCDDAMAEARRELGRAKRARWLSRVVTLGLRRR